MGVQTSTHTLANDVPYPLKGEGFAGVQVNLWVSLEKIEKTQPIILYTIPGTYTVKYKNN